MDRRGTLSRQGEWLLDTVSNAGAHLVGADWPETTIATGDLTEAVTRLKQEHSGGYLLAQAGVRFARSLVEPSG